MKKLKRIATVAVAAIAFQLVAVSPAFATDDCSISGGTLYVVNSGLTLYIATDDYDYVDYIYCDVSEYFRVDAITSGKVVVVPDLDGSSGGDELIIDLENYEMSGEAADWRDLEFDITLESDDDFELDGSGVTNIASPLVSSHKLQITVDNTSFSVPTVNLSGDIDVQRPETSELDIYGGDDNDVIDVSGASGFYEDQIDIDGEDGYDVVYGSDNEDDIYAEYIYPGLAERGPDGYDYIQGSDKCGGYVCMLSYKGISQDLEVETDYTYSGDGSRWYHSATSYISSTYSVLVLGSGDDTMVIGEVVEWKKVLGGPGDDLLLGYGSSEDRLYGGTGDDVLKGFAGDDILVGGKGKDRLVGGYDYDICRSGEMNTNCEWVN